MKRLLFCVVMIFSFALAGFGSVLPSASANNDAILQNASFNEGPHHHHHHRRHHHHHHVS